MYELSETKYEIAANNVQTVCLLSEYEQKLPTKSARTFVQQFPSSCTESSAQVPVTPIGGNRMYCALWEQCAFRGCTELQGRYRKTALAMAL